MSQRALVVGNWKMNLDFVEAIHLTQQVGVLLRAHPVEHTDVMVAPPFVDLRSVSSVIEADRLALTLAAQHVNPVEAGALTGEISVSMLKRLGVHAVIVGHSERREGFGMTDDIVQQTVSACVSNGLRVIVCCGESADVRQEGEAESFVQSQVASAVAGIKDKYSDLISYAYEPIWAIGSGSAANAQDVSQMLAAVRSALPEAWQSSARILYGGSVNPDNAGELIKQGGADGFLVGGASLKADSFVGIATTVDACYGKSR